MENSIRSEWTEREREKKIVTARMPFAIQFFFPAPFGRRYVEYLRGEEI